VPPVARAGDDLYRALLELSAEAIARFEVVPALPVDMAPDAQVERLLREARVVECNEAFARLHGRRVEETVGHLFSDLVPAESRRGPLSEFVRAGHRLVACEVARRLEDGSVRWSSVSALGVVEEGRLQGYWVALHDITARKLAETERARRDEILQAVAFGAARLLAPGSWESKTDDVIGTLGGSAGVARAWVAEVSPDPDGMIRMLFRAFWGQPGWEIALDDPRLRGGVRGEGLGDLFRELRAGRPIAVGVSCLDDAARSFPSRMGSKAFAAVPIFADGEWWGFLGFGETRYDREWTTSEIDALKAAAAVLGAAIERDRAEGALRESEERFKLLSAAAFEGIAITENGVFLDANEQLAQMLGCGVKALIGRRATDFVVETDRPLVEAKIRSGSQEPYQHRAQRRDGSVFPVEVRGRSIPYGGRTIRVSAIHDVSERVQAEDRQRNLESDLRQAAEEWRRTFDALDLGIVLADAEGRIVRLNRAALAMATDARFGAAVGRNLADLAAGEPWNTVLDMHGRVGAGGSSVVAEARDAETGRSSYLLASPWFRGEGQPPWAVLTFRDVTDYTTMQAQLRRARTLEAMGQLVAGVAHEVRNPLFSISATLDALESEFGQRPEYAEYAGLLRSQVGRLTQLMRDLLDYGKPSVLRARPTRFADVVRRAARSCAALARERQVRMEEAVDASLPLLEILLANAIQHAPAGSAVRVVGALDATGPEPLARCTVEDEGPGIALQDIGQLFEPFFSRRKGGTGLGLPIVQRVAEAHGGRVTAENRALRGARFTLVLPVAQGNPEEGAHG
jgi:PAS domain S-box-containing protein